MTKGVGGDGEAQGAIAGLGLLVVAGCSGQAAGEATTSAASPTTSTSTTAPSTPTTTKPTTTRSSASAAPQTVSFLLTCSVGGKYLNFSDYQSALAAGTDDYCEAKTKLGTVYTDQQRQAVAAAYDGNIDNLDTLYGICGQRNTFYTTKILSAEQAKEAAGVLILCPDHPRAPEIQASLDQFDGKASAASSVAAAEAAGTLVSDGSYLIGTDIQPGTWQSIGERVNDCYWQLSDAQGEIIDNNFISVAPKFTIEIPESASGFTVRGCSFERIG